MTSTHVEAPAPSTPAETPKAAIGFALLATAQLLLILAISIVVVPITTLAAEASYTRSDIALVASGYGLVFSGLLLFGSRIGDAFGRRRILLIGLTVFAVASLIGAAAPGYPAMVLSRLIQGAGAALAAPAALGLVTTIYPRPDRRSRALAIFGVMGSVGGIGGILASGVIATWLSWRFAFIVPAIIATVIVVLGRRYLPAPPPAQRGPLDGVGAFLATFGLLGLGYALMRAPEAPLASAEVLVPALGGAALLTAFVAVQARVRHPLLPLDFLRSRRRLTAWTALLVITATNAVSTFLLTLYFQQVRGYAPGEVAVTFLPFALIMTTSFFSGRLIARHGPGRVAALGLLTAAVGVGLTATIRADGSTLPLVLLGMSVLPFGVGLTFSGATVTAMSDVPDRQTGLAGGIVNTAIEIGGAGGTATATAIVGVLVGVFSAGGAAPLDATASAYGGALALVAVLLVVVAVMCARVLPDRKTPTE
ncbi:MFS transporter [Stackebrandtia soli]|uniref:MFS transporter n=1 Tax=Stackebrandtia soli TaxID=1892856 RepID=UPI0039E7C244